MKAQVQGLLAVIAVLGGCATTSGDRTSYESAAAEQAPGEAVVRGVESWSEPDIRFRRYSEALEPAAPLLVRVVDVGPGLCVVGLTPDGYAFLVDAGHWNHDACAEGVAKLLPPDVGLSMVVLTHSDSDHLSDLPEIVAERDVDTLLWTGRVPKGCNARSGQGCAGTFVAALGAIGDAAAAGSTVINLDSTPLEPGQVFELGDVEITFIAGWSDFPEPGGMSPSERENAVSIIAKISHEGRSILVSGDAVGRPLGGSDETTCTGSEGWVVRQVAPELLSSDVLVASHHGGDNGSASCFIAAVAPEWVIFSAGNDHGHPESSTVERFLAAGVPVDRLLRTDRGSNYPKDIEDGEWQEPPEMACGDTYGDDDITIIFPAQGDVTVSHDQADPCE